MRHKAHETPKWWPIAAEVAMEKHPNDSAKAYEEMQRIRSLMIDIERAKLSIRDIETEAKERASSQVSLIDEAQAECQHERTKYHPDPSGNNDYHRECLICGKYL